ncbi:hypothetical protein DDW44_05045 [Streptomyces tirandamycinicus]|uniref:Uncharacterized protein n=1 Tax=Streptomyces tirandamycinicus TaxID=2174846 RepID=A0A2S1SPB3_9ACTN|nr:hypothetical protein DDW44_05045 [Streptomyces tirandamycinicus]
MTATAAIAFLSTRVPFLGCVVLGSGAPGPGVSYAGTEVPVPRSLLTNSEQRSWFFRFTPKDGAAGGPRGTPGRALQPPADGLPGRVATVASRGLFG